MDPTRIKNSRRAFLGTLALGATAVAARGARVVGAPRRSDERQVFSRERRTDESDEPADADRANLRAPDWRITSRFAQGTRV
jgi:hypothetical protein